jgi:hypothetical protein
MTPRPRLVLVLVLVLVLSLVLDLGCKDRSKPHLRRVTPPADAPGPAPPVDAPPPRFDPFDPALLDGATVHRDAADLAATDLGPDPVVDLVQRLGPVVDNARTFTLLLVARGNRTVVVELGTYRESVLPHPAELPDGSLIRLRPRDPPRPWAFEDSGFSEAPLPSVEPVHVAYRTHLPGEADTFALVEVGRTAFAVHHLHTTNADPSGPTWRQLLRITVGPEHRDPRRTP